MNCVPPALMVVVDQYDHSTKEEATTDAVMRGQQLFCYFNFENRALKIQLSTMLVNMYKNRLKLVLRVRIWPVHGKFEQKRNIQRKLPKFFTQ